MSWSTVSSGLTLKVRKKARFAFLTRRSAQSTKRGSRTVSTILSALASRLSGSARRDVYYALAQVGGEVAVAVLKKGLLEGGRDEAQTCAQGLAQLDDAEARETLLAAAMRPERPVARAAMNALANLEGSDVRDLMQEQLRGSDDEMVN